MAIELALFEKLYCHFSIQC